MDIIGYRELKLEPAAPQTRHGVPRNPAHFRLEGLEWSESNWPGRARGLPSMDSKAIYSASESFAFQIPSYGAYNRWRKHMAWAIGWKSIYDVWRANPYCVLYPQFYELLKFSDDSGVLGPEVSSKLFADFVKFDFIGESLFLDNQAIYANFRKVFALAADAGAVVFF